MVNIIKLLKNLSLKLSIVGIPCGLSHGVAAILGMSLAFDVMNLTVEPLHLPKSMVYFSISDVTTRKSKAPILGERFVLAQLQSSAVKCIYERSKIQVVQANGPVIYMAKEKNISFVLSLKVAMAQNSNLKWININDRDTYEKCSSVLLFSSAT